ncbi:ParA family protein [Culicoidibacter larvae]|nr:ParA family protein [Culicoidibacter larvae]
MSDMKIISIGTLKGGVGKTGILFHLAGILAEEGKRVLCIDVDPQANLTTNFGVDISGTYNSTMNIFSDIKRPDLIVNRGPIDELPTLDLLPSSIFLTSTELQLVSMAGRENKMMNYIADNINWFSKYDYILIDTNPSMSIINQNAFKVADDILLIGEASQNSYNGAELFISMWGEIAKDLNIDNNIGGFIINKAERNVNATKEFIEFVKSDDSSIKELVAETIIPKNIKVTEAAELENVPINIYDKNATSYKALFKLVNELKAKDIF